MINKLSINSTRSLVCIICISDFMSNLLPVGAIALVNPSFKASFILFCVCGAGRSAPDKLISPKITLLIGSARSSFADKSAATTAKSAAGSVIFNPPATLRYTS